jgi:hypothetical protein
MADTLASGASERKLVEVQVLSRPPRINLTLEPPPSVEVSWKRSAPALSSLAHQGLIKGAQAPFSCVKLSITGMIMI